MLEVKRQIKDALYEQFARTTKALSSPKRIEILELLSQGEKTVETIAEQANLGIKNASAQVKELKSALMVDSRRDGKYVYYRVASSYVADLLLGLRTFGEKNFAEIQKIASEAFEDSDSLEPINRKQLLGQAKKGEIILLDVRPSEEFQHSHLPFAISVPISELQKELRNLPKDKEIVAYCRGPYCFFAKEAVEMLKKKGFRASRLRDSVHEWASHGLPVESQQKA
ncbi:MAG: ArsR family transcriptional regulator [Bdellovibrio sp. 28-41-41]|nr:MAG: ArsR family transcriptional regulator [Bdellovibrio sp. 28-41-41]